MPRLNEFILKLANVFERLSIPYAFGGAFATAYWGTPRSTQAVDCLVSVPAIQFQRFSNELDAIGCVVPDSQGARSAVTVAALQGQIEKDSSMAFEWSFIRADLFVPIVGFQDNILRRAVRKPLEHAEINVTTAEDLILLKMAFHRQKDILDVRGILQVQGRKLDLALLVTEAAKILDNPSLHELESLIKVHTSE